MPSVFPISFAIHDGKFGEWSYSRQKIRGFSKAVPNMTYSYSYDTEEEYNKQYIESYFAITSKKAGWDCLRHYEIIAAGCIPYFDDIANCPRETLTFFPKEIVLKAMSLPGIDRDNMTVDESIFPKEEYFRLRDLIVDHAKLHMTCSAIAKYVASTHGVSLDDPNTRVLFVNVTPTPDYQKTLLLTGFKELLGKRCICLPYEEEYIYDDYDIARVSSLYGRGFNYARVVPSSAKTSHTEQAQIRSELQNVIQNGNQPVNNCKQPINLVVYGSWHRTDGNPDGHLISNYTRCHDIPCALVCGEDIHSCSLCTHDHSASLLGQKCARFIRELGTAK